MPVIERPSFKSLKPPADVLVEAFPGLYARLVKYGRQLGTVEAEAQDLAMQAWQWAWRKSGESAATLPPEDFERVAFRKMTLLTFDLFGSAERRRRAPLDDVPEPAASEMPEAYRVFLQVYWGEVLKLDPVSRAAILLKMDEEMLRMLQPRGRAELPAAIPIWEPPPPLEGLALPADDALVAQKLGVTVVNLQTIRSRGKARLWAGVRAWGEGGP